ncbi:hypothetical protein QM012_005286 [Aureobasidium pullulans]|uniref:Uncharacterized protein n=1 Tax=Aureobasidium pullulans TaxID=5580 RepID=A0ABR0T5C2_AURPU
MSHPADIEMPDYDSAYALFQAELAGGDTDGDTEMGEGSFSLSSSSLPGSNSPPEPSVPLYNNIPPHSFDIPLAHQIDLTSELTRPGGPLPLSGPYFDIDITQTLNLMLDRYQKNGERFFRLKWALNYLSQGFYPACKYPGCTSRCRIVDHNLKVLSWKRLQAGGEDHLRYVVTEKEHAVFLCVSCRHENFMPSFMWKTRVVAFMADPVVETKTYERWATPEFFFNRARDATSEFAGLVGGTVLSRRERRVRRRTLI